MQLSISKNKKAWFLLSLIMLIGFAGRIWHLDFQSLWLDELHTVNESDPSISWKELFNYLKHSDQHPPLYFIIERICFSLFGYTSFVARIPSVIAGTLSIWAVFLLGKELFNKSTGFIAASVTTVNYYNLYYSQEARDYIFTFLFVTISFLYLIKCIKTLSLKNAILYGITTLLLLYSHYYSLMALCSQIVIIILLFFAEPKDNKLVYFKRFAVSGIIIALGYLPCLPFLLSLKNIKSFWIGRVSNTFLSDYFFEYFGNANLLKPLLILFLLLFVFKVFSEVLSKGKKLKTNPVLLSFVILFIWIFISYLIPYLRSVLVFPMLYPRYTIIVLPAYLIAIAYGISSLPNKIIKAAVLSVFLILSVVDITIIKQYYTRLNKTQFREMVEFVCKNNFGNFPMIDEISSWHQQYYFKLNGVKPDILAGKKIDLTDSIMHPGSSLYGLKGFWIIGGHNDPQLSKENKQLLSQKYLQLNCSKYYDAWAELYVAKNESDDIHYIKCHDYEGGNISPLPEDDVLAIWSGATQTKPIFLKKGKYSIEICARGTEAKNEYPILFISADGKKIGEMVTSKDDKTEGFILENTFDKNIRLNIEMTNDYVDPATKDDRNAFIRCIILKRIDG